MKTIMKRLTGFIIASIMLLSMIPVGYATPEFVDFPTGWSREAMEAAVNNGLLQGDGDMIRPQGKLTRAEMAAIVVRAFNAQTKADISAYQDVSPSAWYYESIAKAVKMGALNGISDTEMAPEEPITREQVFTVLARILVLSSDDTSALNRYLDANQISPWAANHMAVLAQRGYVNGDGTGHANPKAYITREEFAQFMHNTIRTYITKPGTYSSNLEGIVVLRVGKVTLQNLAVTSDLVIGDGVGTESVKITNVTVEKRLLTRGGTMTLKNTKLGEVVVVNNVNGVTKFNNYRSEAVFKGLIENTPAEFLKRFGGSGGSYNPPASNTVKVTFYETYSTDERNMLGNGPYPIESGKSFKDSGYVVPVHDRSIPGYKKNKDVASVYEDEGVDFTHKITPSYWYLNDDDDIVPFDVEQPITKDTNVYLMYPKVSLYFSLDNSNLPEVVPEVVTVTANYGKDNIGDDDNTRVLDSLKDMAYSAGGQLSKALNLNNGQLEKDLMDKVLTRLESMGLVDSDKNIMKTVVPIQIKNVIKEETADGMVKAAIQDMMVNYEQNDAFVQYVAKTLGIEEGTLREQLGKPDFDKKQLAADMYNALKQLSFYNTFMDEVFNEDTFTITNQSSDTVDTEISFKISQLIKQGTVEAMTRASVAVIIEDYNNDKNKNVLQFVAGVNGITLEQLKKDLASLSQDEEKKNAYIDELCGYVMATNIYTDFINGIYKADQNGEYKYFVTTTGNVNIDKEIKFSEFIKEATIQGMLQSVIKDYKNKDNDKFLEYIASTEGKSLEKWRADLQALEATNKTEFDKKLNSYYNGVLNSTLYKDFVKYLYGVEGDERYPGNQIYVSKVGNPSVSQPIELTTVLTKEAVNGLVKPYFVSLIENYDQTENQNMMLYIAVLNNMLLPDLKEELQQLKQEQEADAQSKVFDNRIGELADSMLAKGIYKDFIDGLYPDLTKNPNATSQIKITENATITNFSPTIKLIDFVEQNDIGTLVKPSIVTLLEDYAKPENAELIKFCAILCEQSLEAFTADVDADSDAKATEVWTELQANSVYKDFINGLYSETGTFTITDKGTVSIDKDFLITQFITGANFDTMFAGVIEDKLENQDEEFLTFIAPLLGVSVDILKTTISAPTFDSKAYAQDILSLSVFSDLKTQLFDSNETFAINDDNRYLLETFAETLGTLNVDTIYTSVKGNADLKYISDNIAEDDLKAIIEKAITGYQTVLDAALNSNAAECTKLVNVKHDAQNTLGNIFLIEAFCDTLEALDFTTAMAYVPDGPLKQMYDTLAGNQDEKDKLSAAFKQMIEVYCEGVEEENVPGLKDKIEAAKNGTKETYGAAMMLTYSPNIPGGNIVLVEAFSNKLAGVKLADAKQYIEPDSDLDNQIQNLGEEKVSACFDVMIEEFCGQINTAVENVRDSTLTEAQVPATMNFTYTFKDIVGNIFLVEAFAQKIDAMTLEQATEYSDQLKALLQNVDDETAEEKFNTIKGQLSGTINGALDAVKADNGPDTKVSDEVKFNLEYEFKDSDVGNVFLIEAFVQKIDNISLDEALQAADEDTKKTIEEIQEAVGKEKFEANFETMMDEYAKKVQGALAKVTDPNSGTNREPVDTTMTLKYSVKVSGGNIFLVETFHSQIKNLTLDDALEFIPDNELINRLIDIIGKDTLNNYFKETRDSYCKGLEEKLKDATNVGEGVTYTAEYTTTMNIVIDAMSLLTNLYNQAVPELEERLNNQPTLRYNENPYLQYLVKHDPINKLTTRDEALTDPESSGYDPNVTGYRIKGIMDYYDYLLSILIVSDDALCWYGDKGNFPSEEDFKAVREAILARTEYVHERLNEILRAYESQGTLPAQAQQLVDQIKQINELLTKYNEQIEAIINRYLDSDINQEIESGNTEKLEKALDLLFGSESPTFTIDNLYAIFYQYDDTVQTKLKELIKSGKLEEAIDRFESTSLGSLFDANGRFGTLADRLDEIKNTGRVQGAIDNIYDLLYIIAYEGIEHFKVDEDLAQKNTVDSYQATVGSVTFKIKRYYN